jgi:ubiquinone biosynthesis protein
MRLIPEQLSRHAHRAAEVGGILAKYGLADWLAHSGFELPKKYFTDRDGERLTDQSRPVRIRLAVSELGTSFIKLGQMLSTRGDLIGWEIAEELAKLQNDVPPDPPGIAMATVSAELSKPVDELFATFAPEPMASASIGQVHRARLHDGTEVVVKVQHPDIQSRILADLDILRWLAEVAEKSAELRRYQPVAVVSEFHRSLLRELDFRREQRNLQEFATSFATNASVRFPRTYAEFSTSRVLTMELLQGFNLRDTARIDILGVDREELARRGATLWMDMIFRDGFYHADPHPGNILVMEGGTLGIVDCGMVGRIDEGLRENIEEILMAVAALDARLLARILTRLCAPPPGFDEATFSADLADFISFYGGQPIEHFELGNALSEISRCISRYRLILPSALAQIIKVLVMLDGTAKLLNPQINISSIIVPYQKDIFLRQLSPRRQVKKLRRFLDEWNELAQNLPRGLAELFQQVREGKFDVHLEHRRLEPVVNRLVMGMICSSLFLGASLMLSNKVPPLAGGHSVPGLLFILFSGVLGSRLLRFIWRNR